MAIQFVFMALFGIVVALIAHSKGRTAVGWFFIGALTGFIGLIIILVVSNLKKEQEKEDRLRAENRRLREQVRKDRQVADRRHKELGRRIGAHDQIQGIETNAGPQNNLMQYDDSDPSADEDDDDDEDLPPRRPRSRTGPSYS